MIQVCCAIIIKDSLILAVQHGADSRHPYQWEFPGGKVQTDETEEQCIIREIEEELTVKVEIVSRMEAVEFDYGNKQIRLIPYACRIASGEIILNEHHALKWFSLNEWQTIHWLEADRELIIRNYQKILSLTENTQD
jgi:8-oxo-dGTP diphosphatase